MRKDNTLVVLLILSLVVIALYNSGYLMAIIFKGRETTECTISAAFKSSQSIGLDVPTMIGTVPSSAMFERRYVISTYYSDYKFNAPPFHHIITAQYEDEPAETVVDVWTNEKVVTTKDVWMPTKYGRYVVTATVKTDCGPSCSGSCRSEFWILNVSDPYKVSQSSVAELVANMSISWEPTEETDIISAVGAPQYLRGLNYDFELKDLRPACCRATTASKDYEPAYDYNPIKGLVAMNFCFAGVINEDKQVLVASEPKLCGYNNDAKVSIKFPRDGKYAIVGFMTHIHGILDPATNEWLYEPEQVLTQQYKVVEVKGLYVPTPINETPTNVTPQINQTPTNVTPILNVTANVTTPTTQQPSYQPTTYKAPTTTYQAPVVEEKQSYTPIIIFAAIVLLMVVLLRRKQRNL